MLNARPLTRVRYGFSLSACFILGDIVLIHTHIFEQGGALLPAMTHSMARVNEDKPQHWPLSCVSRIRTEIPEVLKKKKCPQDRQRGE